MAPPGYRWPGDLDDIEDVQRYRPGGFHPIHIGDVLGDRYQVLHKLGCGGFSTVWLARDTTNQHLRALKVLAANAPETELDILLYLAKAATIHSSILTLYNHFTITGPNGSHSCLVLSVLGPSIDKIQQSDLVVEGVWDAGRQIADALTHLHQSGVCHGDLTHANVLFALSDVDHWSDFEVYQTFGAPKEAQLLCFDGSAPSPSAPRQVVEAIKFEMIDPGLLSGGVCIVDFGLSFLTERPPPGIPGTPRSFLAPELCFGATRSPANDIWGLGCLIFELYANRILFPLIFDRLDLLIGTIVDTLGQLPLHWEGQFFNQSDRTFEPGQVDFWYDPSFKPSRLLERQIAEKCPRIVESQRPLFKHLLNAALCLNPAHRLTAAEILSHPWFSTKDSLGER